MLNRCVHQFGDISWYFGRFFIPLLTLWFAIRHKKAVPIFTDWNGAKDK